MLLLADLAKTGVERNLPYAIISIHTMSRRHPPHKASVSKLK